MKQFYITNKIQRLVSSMLILFGFEGLDVGLTSTDRTVSSSENTQRSFGLVSFKAMTVALFLLLGMGSSVWGQTVATYSFASGTTGTLNAMTGSTQLIGPSLDDTASSVTNIGFTFTYAGTAYTQFSVNVNGLMRLGATAVSGSGTTSYSNSAANAASNTPVIMPYWDDLYTGTNGKVHYLLTGTAPNRSLIVEWYVTVPRSSTGTSNAKFQCKLDETTNVITITYGSGMVANTTNSGASIGLATSATVYNSVTTTSNTSSTSTFNTANTSAINSGVYYTFTPPSPCATPSSLPTALTYGTTTATAIAGSFTAATTAPSGYLVVRSTSSTLSAGPVDGTSYTAATALGGGTVVQTPGTGVTFSDSGLTGNTKYYYFVYAYNNTSCTGGPKYSAVLTDSNGKVTCPAAPTAPVNSGVTSSGGTISWTAPAGGSAGSITYTVEIYTDAAFTAAFGSPITGLTTPTYTIASGLSPATAYYFKIKANNGSCDSAYLTTGTFTTLANTPSITSFSPSTICQQGGQVVTITGTNLGGTTQVQFPALAGGTVNGTSIVNVSATQVTVVVPANITDGNIILTNTGGSSTSPTTLTAAPTPATPVVSTAGTYCNSTTLTATTTDTSGVTMYYQGTTSGGTSTATAASSQSVSATGTYYFRTQSTVGCWSAQGSAAVTINTLTVSTQPSTAGQTKCIGSTATALTVAATKSTGTLSYQWYSNTANSISGGTAITGATSASYTPLTTTAGTTYYYCVVGLTGSACTSATSNVSGAIVVNALPTISGTNAVCTGATTQLTAGTGTWSSATPSVATVNSTTGLVTGVAAGTSVITYTDTATGCSNTVTVTVTAMPSAVSIATPAAFCSGKTTALTATGGNVSSSVTNLSQNFDAGGLPTGWTRTNVGALTYGDFTNTSEATSSGNTWSAAYGGSGNCMFFYSYLISSGNAGSMTTPAIDLSANTSASLTFYMYNSSGTDVLKVYAKNGASGTYAQVGSTLSTYSAWTQITINLNSYTGTGFNAVYIKFEGTSDYGLSNIGIDNVVVSGNSNVVYPIIWSPTTDLYTDSAAATAYTGGAAATVYTKTLGSKVYTASATNGSCVSSQQVTVAPNALPTITVNSPTICAGSSATLTANGASTYVWSPATGLSATTGTSVTANPPATTVYTVSGTDANGCVGSAPLTVTVNTPVSISVQPGNQVVLQNASASFAVTAAGTGLSYQWQVSTDGGSTWAPLSGETGSSYSIDFASASQNNFKYRCVVTGTCNTVTSSVATLTVGSVSITQQPTNQSVCSTTSATFSVVIDGNVTSYQWQSSTNGTDWTDVSGATTATLTLSSLTSANSGTQYHCVLNGGDVVSNAATLTVYDAVAIGTQPSGMSVCNGASASFTVAATGSGLSYQWQVSTDGSSWSPVSGATSATYTIASTTASLNNNQYRVVVSGTAPCSSLTSNGVMLNVIDVTASASSATICLGSSVTLNATFTGSPASAGASWTSTTGSGATTAVTGTSASVTPTAAGTYVYTLTTNGSCVLTKTVSVTVNPAPIIASATATPAAVCSGATIALAATSLAVSTGNATIGSNTTTITSNGLPYRVTASTSGRAQYLVLASELSAAGLSAGNINSIAFNVSSISGSMSNLTIKMGATTSTVEAATYLTPTFTTVLTLGAYTPTVGTNTHTFTTPFVWDGTSNVVIDICGAIATSGTCTVQATTTTFVSTSGNSGANVCTGTSGTAISTRPVIIFNGQVATNITSTYNWSWNTSPALTTATGSTSVVNTTSAIASQSFTVTATNATTGCTATMSTSNVSINAALSAPTATNSTQCGAGTPTCSVTGSGVSGNKFKWYTVATGGTAITGQTASALSSYSVSTTTTFYVSEVSADGLCESARSAVTVTVSTPPAFALSSATATNCAGSASTTPVTIATGAADYTSFSWTNTATVSGNATTGWLFSPTTTTTYTVTASNTTSGCSNTASVVVTPTALPVLTATASPAAICVGASTTITALTNAVGAGTVTLGTGSSTASSYDNPFYSLWSHTQDQILVKASELTAAGLYAGNITSLGLTVTSGTTIMPDFSISIKNTANTALSTLDSTGFTTVYSNATGVTPVIGLNTITFTTPYNWDGTSNLLIKICWGNSTTTATQSNTVLADATSYVSIVNAHNTTNTSGSTICSNTTVYGTFSNRPKFVFGGQVSTQGVGTLAYSWNDANASTGNVLTVSPTATTTYTVSGYNATTGCTGTKAVTVTVYNPPTAPSVTNSTQCGAKVPTAAVADTNGYTTPTFKWYADTTTTTALQTSTSTTYTTSISATTTFYVSVVSPGGCESPRAAVTVTVNTPATVTVSNAVTVCSGSSTTLTANGASSYTWSPAATLSSATGASVSATPTATTTYSVVGVDANGCTTATKTVVVTVSQPLPTITAGVNNASVCLGGTVNLTSTSVNSLVNFSEGFEGATFPPTGWTNLNAGTGNSWTQGTSYTCSGTKSLYYAYNSSNAANAWMITPSQTLTAGTTYTVSFSYVAYGSTTLPESLKLTVGNSNTVAAQSNVLLNLSTITNSTCSTATATFTPTTTGVYYFGLNCYSIANAWYLGVDNFAITGGQSATYAWTSSPAGFTSTSQNPSNVTVNGATTYTVTATSGACTSSSSVSVTPSALPTVTLTGDATICNGNAANLTANGASTYAWTSVPASTLTTNGSQSVSPTVTTTYTVVGTSAAGCTGSASWTVNVSQPVTSVAISQNQNIIPGQLATFTATPTGGTSLAYNWQYSVDGGYTWSDIASSDYYVSGSGIYAGVSTATLTVHNATLDMSGYQYQCVVTPAQCTSSYSPAASLSVSNVGIVTQPAPVAICISGSASFTTVASSQDPLLPITYQWEYNDQVNGFQQLTDGSSIAGLTITGSTASTLNIDGLTSANNAWQFHCIVNGFVASTDVAITVNVPATVTTVPADATVCVGGAATFTTVANASTSGASVTVQWNVSTNGTTWSPITSGVTTTTDASGVTASTLVVNGATVAMDGYQYQSVVTQTGCSVSNTAVLHINNPTVSSQPIAATVGAGNSVTFSGDTAAAAPTYQWQYATTVNGTYANVVDNTPAGVTYSGATTNTLTVNTTTNTAASTAIFYHLAMTSSGCSVTTNGAQLTVQNYCVNTTSNTTNFTFINNFVTTGGLTTNISNNSGATIATSGYGNYSTQYVDQYPGNTVSYTPSVTGGSATNTKIGIWVDWNNDYDFADAGETVVAPVAIGAGSFVIPSTAIAGNYRMRVVVNRTATPAACQGATTNRTETEDYTIKVVALPACTGTPVAGTATIAKSSVCSGNSTSVSVTGYSTNMSGLSGQWYSSTDNVNFTAISGATSPNYTTSALTATTYYYYTLTCTNAGDVSQSNTVSITVNNPQVLSTTPASICGTGTATLGATTNTGSTLNWYAAATGGSSLGTGNTFTTPSITSSTTYYAEASVVSSPFNVGLASDVSANLSSLSYYGMYFASTNAAIINSVQIYPSTAGTLIISLANAAGTTVDTRTFTIASGDISTTVPKLLNLGFNVPAGSTGWSLNYDLSINRGAGTYTYPSTANGFSITGNTLDGDNLTSGTRYYFYNWNVSTIACTSARTAVTATVTPKPTAAISYAGSPFCGNAAPAAVTLTGTNAYTGGTFTAPSGLTINGATGTIDPSTSTAGTYTVTYTMNAVGSCAAQTATTSVTINSSVLTADFSYSSASYCSNNASVTPTITGTSGVFTVSPSGLTVNGTTGAINFATSTPGTYTVTNTVTSCGNNVTSTATVNVYQLVSVTTQPTSVTICPAANASFTVAGSGTSVAYHWQVKSGTTWTSLTDDATYSGTSTATLTITAASVTLNGAQYRAVVSDANASVCGSVNSSVATLTVSQPAAPVITPTTSTICPGGIQTLTVSNLLSGTYQLGTGTLNTSTTGLTPFSSLYEGAREQYLVKASELTALGITAGNLTSLSFNVTTAGAYAQSNFSIKLGTTSATDITGFVTPTNGFTTVYSVASLAAQTTGWKTFTFSSPYAWDGVSNIVVDVCHDNDVNGTCSSCWGTSATVQYTDTTNNSTVGTYGDNAPSCGTVSTNYYYFTSRPNMKFATQGGTTTWSPTTGLYTNAAATTAYTGGNAGTVYAMPSTTTTYTASNTNTLGCSNTSTTTVTVLPTPTFGGITQPTITCSGSPTTFNLTGLLPSTTSTISYSINGGTVQTVTGVVSDASGNGSFTLSLAGFTNGQSLAITSITRTDAATNCSATFSTGNSVTIAVRPLVTYYADADGDGYGNLSAPLITCQGQPSGYVTDSTDCNDSNAAMHTTYSFYTDADADGYGAGTAVSLCAVNATTPPSGYSVNNTDCNDADATAHATATYYVDADADGYGSTTSASLCAATAPTGYSVNNTDCNDSNASMHTSYSFYADTDADGYGAGHSVTVCAVDAVTPPAGYAANNTDCNDADASVHSTATYYVDADHDGYGSTTSVSLCAATAPSGYASNNTDCNDSDATVNANATYYIDADGDGYDAGTASLCAASAPTGYSATTNGTDCNDAAYSTSNTCSSLLNLKVVLQGYYDADAHAMRPVMANEGVGTSDTDVDTVTVELHDASGALVSSTTGMLQTNGTVSLTFAPVSGDYYIVVSHRNTIVTSSSNPVTFVSGVATTYDFTTSASQAYGDNQVMVETGVYAMYTGDLNQDGYIDATDFPQFDSDNQMAISGEYISTDMNGDGYVDATDFPIFDSNNQNGITSVMPF